MSRRSERISAFTTDGRRGDGLAPTKVDAVVKLGETSDAVAKLGGTSDTVVKLGGLKIDIIVIPLAGLIFASVARNCIVDENPTGGKAERESPDAMGVCSTGRRGATDAGGCL